MLHFNELYITEDKQHLVIDVEIDDLPIYDDCYLEKITVDVADSCDGDGLFTDPKYEWKFKPEVPGDTNGDGIFNENDLIFWKEMLEFTFIPRKNVRERITEEGNIEYYYKKNGEEFLVTKQMIDLYDYVVANYEDPNGSNDDVNEFGAGLRLLTYIGEFFTNEGIYKAFFGREYDPQYKPYDFNQDSECSLGDINMFINRILFFIQNPPDYEKLYINKERHKRLCLDILKLGVDDLSKHMFIVRAEATGGDQAKIASLGCTFDQCVIEDATFYSQLLYSRFMDMAAGYAQDCKSNMDNIVDYIMRYYAFDFAMRNGDWCSAWQYLQSLNGGGNTMNYVIGKPCGCHGPY